MSSGTTRSQTANVDGLVELAHWRRTNAVYHARRTHGGGDGVRKKACYILPFVTVLTTTSHESVYCRVVGQ